jgi:hypothetical protein
MHPALSQVAPCGFEIVFDHAIQIVELINGWMVMKATTKNHQTI